MHNRWLYSQIESDPAQPTLLETVARVAHPLTAVDQARSALFATLALAALIVRVPAALLDRCWPGPWLSGGGIATWAGATPAYPQRPEPVS